MRLDLLQPWVTVQGTHSVSTIAQEEESWLDLGGCCDVHAWVDVTAVTPLPSGGSLTLNLESSPTKDEFLFAPIATAPLLSASPIPFVLKSVSGASSVNPVGRWLRWRLTATGGTSGTWGATIRIRVARARTPFFTPTAVPGCALWLRADLGVILVGGDSNVVLSWMDQSGNGNTLVATGSPTLARGGINGFPSIETSPGSPGNYLSVAGTTTVAQGDSMIIVFQAIAPLPAYNQVVFGGAGATDQSISTLGGDDTTIALNAGNAAYVPVGQLTTSASIVQVDWNGSVAQLYQNGVAQGSPVFVGGDSIQVGSVGSLAGSGSYPFAGYLSEVLLYNQLLTPAWRTLVHRYLGGRYGLTVP